MLKELNTKVLAGERLTKEEAVNLVKIGEDRIMKLLAGADEIKNKFNGQQVSLCSIINAKSGSCSEDCSFCAQSSHYETKAETYPLVDKKEILNRAQQMEAEGAHHFGLVTSGREVLSEKEFSQIIDSIVEIQTKTNLEVCASLGTLDKKSADALAEVGLARYNHNLETSESYFPKICTTHKYEERKKTVKLLKERGIEVCCGGIIGLGEDLKDRIELAFTLRELGVDSVPINVLTPVEGTPLEASSLVPPLEVLKTAAIFRFILPEKTIKLCGGRESNLRNLQSLALLSGINGLLIGNYLTTSGRDAKEDLQMIKDLGLSS